MTRPRDWYAVVDYRTGATVYVGTSIYATALTLNPGTVYAFGATPQIAERLALQQTVDKHGVPLREKYDDHGIFRWRGSRCHDDGHCRR